MTKATPDNTPVAAEGPSTSPPAPAADSPAAGTSPHIIGELMHATTVAHMLCIALVTQGVIKCEVFERLAAQAHEGWMAMEANGEGHSPHASAWARARMAELLHDITFGYFTSPSRKSAIISLTAAASAPAAPAAV